MTKYYKSTYYINVYLDREQSGPPTMVHLVLYIGAIEEDRMFYLLEKKIREYLKKIQNACLPEYPEFHQKEIALEILGEFFYKKLKEVLDSQGVELYQLEIYTTPTRRYKVSDRLLLPFQYPGDVVKRIARIREWSQRLYSAGKEEIYEKPYKMD